MLLDKGAGRITPVLTTPPRHNHDDDRCPLQPRWPAEVFVTTQQLRCRPKIRRRHLATIVAVDGRLLRRRQGTLIHKRLGLQTAFKSQQALVQRSLRTCLSNDLIEMTTANSLHAGDDAFAGSAMTSESNHRRLSVTGEEALEMTASTGSIRALPSRTLKTSTFWTKLGLGGVTRRTLGICLLLITVLLWTLSNFLASVGLVRDCTSLLGQNGPLRLTAKFRFSLVHILGPHLRQAILPRLLQHVRLRRFAVTHVCQVYHEKRDRGHAE